MELFFIIYFIFAVITYIILKSKLYFINTKTNEIINNNTTKIVLLLIRVICSIFWIIGIPYLYVLTSEIDKE